MNEIYAKDLFQLQSELTDRKVNMAVSNAIDRVIEQISDLKKEMNARFTEVNNRFTEVNNRFTDVDKQFIEVHKQLSHLDTRLSKLEHRVDINEQTLHSVTTLLTELRSKVITYSFRGGWVLLTTIVLISISQLTQLLHFFIK